MRNRAGAECCGSVKSVGVLFDSIFKFGSCRHIRDCFRAGDKCVSLENGCEPQITRLSADGKTGLSPKDPRHRPAELPVTHRLRKIRLMIEIVEQCRPKISALCHKYGVRRLDLFGSAATERDYSTHSDIDFFFEFDADPTRLADRYFGLIDDLESLLQRKVDLVSIQDARNPYFLQVANRYRTTLYAA